MNQPDLFEHAPEPEPPSESQLAQDDLAARIMEQVEPWREQWGKVAGYACAMAVSDRTLEALGKLLAKEGAE